MKKQHKTTIYAGSLEAWSLFPTLIIGFENNFRCVIGWLKWGIDIQIERI